MIHTAESLLREFISYPTVSSESVTAMADRLANLAEDLAFTVERFQSAPGKENLLAQLGPQEDALVLCGHMDVVPVSGQNWDSDPFTAKFTEERILGRGSCDMKGFIASAYSALQHIDPTKLRRGLTLLWTHDEEVGCMGAHFLVNQLKAEQRVLPTAILIGEPTSSNICHHHGGHTTIELSITGQPAHSSKPHLGVCANSLMLDALDIVRSWIGWLNQQLCPVANSSPVLNIAQLSGGEAINIVPHHAQLRLGLRPMPSHNTQDLLAPLFQQWSQLQEDISHKGGELIWRIPQIAAPLLTPLSTPLQQMLERHLACPEIVGVPFATDGGCLAELNTLPLVCGPGSIDVAHQANEWISRAELAEYSSRLQALIKEWTQTG